MRKRIILGLAIILLLLLTPVAVLAYDYYVTISMQNTGSSDYSYVPLNISINNTALVDNYYITATGLDTRISSGGSELPHMLTDDQVYFVLPELPEGISKTAYYTMGNTPLSNFYIIPGYGGNITIPDAAALEPGSNFKILFDGWINTSGNEKNIVNKSACLSITAGNGNITVYNGTSQLLVISVASGEHEVSVIYAYGWIEMHVDGVFHDSAATGSFADTPAPWVLMSNNSMPYMDYYKYYIPAYPETLVVYYEPNDIINGTTLPDRYGTAQNGIINFGSNPGDTIVETSSLNVVSQTQMAEEDITDPVFTPLTVPDTPPGWTISPNATNYTAIPGSGAVNELLTAGEIPLNLFWIPIMFLATIGLGFWVWAKTEHLMGVAIAGGVALIFFAGIGMLDWWVLMIYAVIAAALCVSEKSYGW